MPVFGGSLDTPVIQGRRKDEYEVNCRCPHFDPADIDVVVL